MTTNMFYFIILVFFCGLCLGDKRLSELVKLPGHNKRDWYSDENGPKIWTEDLPDNFDWRNIGNISYVTKNLNQHIPQYCGSCWAHAALSSIADRIKIARKAKGAEINLSVQFILNCGAKVAGSCKGGAETGAFQFIKETGFVPFDTCLQYEACSDDLKEGHCGEADYKCSAVNTCRSCTYIWGKGSECTAVDVFPNATVADYGTLPNNTEAIKHEIYSRGPVTCGVNANEISKYEGGIVDFPKASKEMDHAVSAVGWGTEEDGKQYWIIRNSWGEYWGEMGYFRIRMGDNNLGIESGCAWAIPGTFSEIDPFCTEENRASCMKNTLYRNPSIPYGKILMDEVMSIM